MKKILFLFYLSVSELLGQSKIAYEQSEIPISSVTEIGGYVGSRIDANRTGSVMGFDIDRYVSMVEAQTHKDWWWIGEQPGKWLESAVLCSAQSNDPELLEKAKRMLMRMEAAQQPDGYLGITDPSLRTAEKPLRGMDPYELYFMLHGLITASEQWSDPQALETAKGLANYFVNTIKDGGAEFWPTSLRSPENYHKVAAGTSNIAGHSVHYGLEGTLLIDPVLRLYQLTNDQRYLDWSQWVVSNIDKWSGWDTYSRLDSVAMGAMGIDEVQPYVHSHTFQMNFLGLLRLYQITGDEAIFRKVKGVWDDVNSRQSFITGGVSVGEHYEKDYIRPLTGNVVETCATMSWMQLTQQLLLLTGDAKYADNIERLLLNHVFASQAFDGDSYRYHTPPNGFKPYEYFHGPDCCTSSGHRIVSMLPLFLLAIADDAIFVNQYLTSQADIALPNGKKVRMILETNYPASDTITILPNPGKKLSFALNLRIPAWCADPQVLINGKSIDSVVPGGYATIDRKWQSGDEVKLILPMQMKWIEHDHFANIVTSRLPGGEIIFDEDKSTPATAPFALAKGPVIYAVDNLWWDGASSPYDVGKEVAYVRTDLLSLKEVELPDELLGPGYEVEVKTVSGEKVKTLAVPFTNVGLWYKLDQPRPERNSKAYSYAVWLQDHESDGFQALIDDNQQLKEKFKDAIDYVLIGHRSSEKAHQQKGQRTGSGSFNGLNFIDAQDWMSFELKVSNSDDTRLISTYWGSDVRRTFDIYANDQKIGEQTLDNNQPGEFFEVSYDIPFELVEGKTDAFGQKVESVTIRFVAHPGSVAGGVFGIKTMKK